MCYVLQMVKNITEDVTLGAEAYLKEVPITDWKANRCSHVFVNTGLKLLKMLTVTNILATLNHALSPWKKTISSVNLSTDKIGTKNEIRFWPSFYPCWADSSIWNWFLSTAFVFFFFIFILGCGLNMVLLPWNMWNYCSGPENQIFCFWT